MPVAAVFRVGVGDDDQVKHPGGDGPLAARAEVLLASCVRLHRTHRHAQIAHTNNPMTTTMVAATRTRSAVPWREGRKGLKPIAFDVTADPGSYRAKPCGSRPKIEARCAG